MNGDSRRDSKDRKGLSFGLRVGRSERLLVLFDYWGDEKQARELVSVKWYLMIDKRKSTIVVGEDERKNVLFLVEYKLTSNTFRRIKRIYMQMIYETNETY